MTNDIYRMTEDDPRRWLLLPPGDVAICRIPLDAIPDGARQATATELLAANLGRPFPWGEMPDQSDASFLWNGRRMGYGGLYHHKWFVTQQGRFGGAANVPDTPPGTLRSCLLYDGGETQHKGNEGYAVVRPVDPVNRDIYRAVQIHAAKHVVADGGHIVVSPVDPETGIVHVGFVGRCLKCKNGRDISFPQLQSAVPEVTFRLLPECRDWVRITFPKAAGPQQADFPLLQP